MQPRTFALAGVPRRSCYAARETYCSRELAVMLVDKASERAEGESMKRRLMIGSLLLVAAVSAHAQSQGQSQSRVVEEIKKVDRERIQAQVNADSVALDRIYADDFIGIGPSGTLRTKKDVLSDFASGSLKFQSITTDDVLIRVYGNAAVETGLSTMKGQDAGKVVPEENRFTRVWIKQGGRWRLVANHYSNLVKRH